jgi:RNA polymerase-binding transcription factor DksA
VSIVRERIVAGIAASDATIAELEREHARTVAASESSNADDEHDPEGSTIAFERQQLAAVLQNSRRRRAELVQALARLNGGTYGLCEGCAGPIPAERLEARPNASTCISCAS